MHDNEAVSRGPESGDMGLLKETEAHETHMSAHPTHDSSEGQRTQPCILVVEDDPTLAALESEFLRAHGYAVTSVSSGELAIAEFRRFTPNLVVLDLELTGTVDGWDVLQALRVQATIPVLLTTSSATAVRKHIRNRGESRITLDHLPKPYPMQALLKRVRRMLMIAPQ
jgi:DNA-binding response OmpR family regulator